MRAEGGDANELGDAGGGPGEGYLSSSTVGRDPGIGSTGGWAAPPAECPGFRGIRGAPAGP